ncbi:MAG: TfoX/Sxy family protein [Acidimicrobiia bacterium]|nr:TfoX/Sxy family protein [Acidimicrobiia bacterium]
MGEKGARLTGSAVEVGDRLAEELAPVGAVTTKKMFGGVGVFTDGTMFAIVDSTGSVFLRADESTTGRFEAADSEKHGRMPYWTVPAEVLDDPDELLAWADQAAGVARAAK